LCPKSGSSTVSSGSGGTCRKGGSLIRERVEQHLTRLLGPLPAGHDIEFVKDPKFGDVASNIAFFLAKTLHKSPRAVAEELVPRLSGLPEFTQVSVGGNGFLNFFLSDSCLLETIAAAGEPDFGRRDFGRGQRVNVEYVSANPTGPLNVANARAGAYGSALVSLLRFTGHDAISEYYVNDSGGQIELFALSVAARVAEQRGDPWSIPEGGYQGDYLVPIAREIIKSGIPRDQWGSHALAQVVAGQRATLERFGVRFDSFVHDSALRPTNDFVIARLAERNYSFKQDGALWFKAKEFGDTEDRVLIKSNGEPTYALTDMNYHRQKFDRGFDRLITIWGADHHGDIARLKGGLQALGYPSEELEIVIVQWATLLRDGKKISMSKRAGEFITIDEVLDEIGSDALKFFVLMRRASQHLEFDLSLAKRTSSENPVYYAQYSHARISSILRFAAEKGVDISTRPARAEFTDPAERTLTKMIMRFPDTVAGAARALEPHRLVYYTLDLANTFHSFYEQARVVSDDREATAFRVNLCQCTRQTMHQALTLLGISAPEKM
jgi:arginyl-tRNA synthetase